MQVLDFELQRQLVPYMRDLVPLPGIYDPDFIAANQVRMHTRQGVIWQVVSFQVQSQTERPVSFLERLLGGGNGSVQPCPARHHAERQAGA